MHNIVPSPCWPVPIVPVRAMSTWKSSLCFDKIFPVVQVHPGAGSPRTQCMNRASHILREGLYNRIDISDLSFSDTRLFLNTVPLILRIKLLLFYILKKARRDISLPAPQSQLGINILKSIFCHEVLPQALSPHFLFLFSLVLLKTSSRLKLPLLLGVKKTGIWKWWKCSGIR